MARYRHDKGAALVEFAIIAPLLFVLIFGVIETSRAIFAYTQVWTAARDGAREATTTSGFADCDAIVSAALQRTSLQVLAADVAVVFTDSDSGKEAICDGNPTPSFVTDTFEIDSGDTVAVTVTGSFSAIVPLLEVFFDGLPLDSTQERTLFISEVVGG